jgi:hypothetical protein
MARRKVSQPCAKTEGVVREGCWAHANRKFHDAVGERPKAANLILRVISHSRLYRPEREWDEANAGGEGELHTAGVSTFPDRCAGVGALSAGVLDCAVQ